MVTEETKDDQNQEQKEAQNDITDFEALYEESFDKRISSGSVVKGTVVQIGADHIMLDVGRKSEGQAPLCEFIDENGNIAVSLGDEVDVYVESINTSKGVIRLSKEKASAVRVWDEVIKAHQDGVTVPAKVVARIKGGLTVNIGIPAFLPSSQADIMPLSEKDLEGLVDQTFDVLVLKYNRRKNNVVVSRREVLEKDRAVKKQEVLATLKKGDVATGVVKNIMSYGAFVDIGGIDGLLHVTDMSWGKVKDPKDKVHTGQELEVKVLEFDSETEKISLGLKQLHEDPWDGIEYRYPIGKKVPGKVTSITNYGAFVEVEEGVEGLVHISEMFWTKRVRHPSAVVQDGQEVDVVVLGVDPSARRISLGIKQAMPNPWEVLEDYYPVGAVVDAKVKNVTDFGVFVSIDEQIDIDGLIHVSDISWDPKAKNPKDLYKKGDVLEAKVLNIDPDSEKFSLGLKQLGPDPWTQVANENPVGSVVTGKITSITDFGAFVEIADGVEGMIHISEVSHDKIDSLADVLNVGQEVEAVVLRVSPENKKIGLSMKALEEGHVSGGMMSMQEKSTEKVATNLGALLKELQNNKD